jgi:hypothetical protein
MTLLTLVYMASPTVVHLEDQVMDGSAKDAKERDERSPGA